MGGEPFNLLSQGNRQPSVTALNLRDAALKESAASQHQSDTRLPARIPRWLILKLGKQGSEGLTSLRTPITYFSSGSYGWVSDRG